MSSLEPSAFACKGQNGVLSVEKSVGVKASAEFLPAFFSLPCRVTGGTCGAWYALKCKLGLSSREFRRRSSREFRCRSDSPVVPLTLPLRVRSRLDSNDGNRVRVLAIFTMLWWLERMASSCWSSSWTRRAPLVNSCCHSGQYAILPFASAFACFAAQASRLAGPA